MLCFTEDQFFISDHFNRSKQLSPHVCPAAITHTHTDTQTYKHKNTQFLNPPVVHRQTATLEKCPLPLTGFGLSRVFFSLTFSFARAEHLQKNTSPRSSSREKRDQNRGFSSYGVLDEEYEHHFTAIFILQKTESLLFSFEKSHSIIICWLYLSLSN